jgi:predicted PurR-regulated permease PerM
MTGEAEATSELKSMDRREQARWLILLASMAGALYLCWLMLEPFVSVLLWAGVLALTFAPVHARILQRIRRLNFSALLLILFVMFVIGVLFGLVTWAIVREIVLVISMV